MKNNKKNILLSLLFVLTILLFPFFVSAQSFSLTSDKSECAVGDYVSVDLNLDTSGNIVNAVQGEIIFPSDLLDVYLIKTGDSVLTLWPQKPILSSSGIVSFAGGVPHGFNSQKANILTVIFKAKSEGQSVINIDKTKALLNDGLGSELRDIKNISVNIPIKGFKSDGDANSFILDHIVDNIEPLPFSPIISTNNFIEGNKFFVAFSTVDKGIGLSHYEIKEEYVLLPYVIGFYSTDWQKAETPYVLKLQHWWSKVYIRAYDSAGNFRQEIINKEIDAKGKDILKVLIILLLLLIFVVLLFIIRKRIFKNKK